MNQQDLEQLSNEEIKKLWQKTVSEARKQRDIQLAPLQAQGDLGMAMKRITSMASETGLKVNGQSRKRPGTTLALMGTWSNSDGEKQPPEESRCGIVDWLSKQDIAGDPELREAPGADNLFFHEQLRIGESEVSLVGRLTSTG